MTPPGFERLAIQSKRSSPTFPRGLQVTFNVFVFFLAFPSLTFLDVSITFWLFLVLAYRVRLQYGYVFRLTQAVDYLLILFPLVALISLIVAPQLPRTTLLSDLKIWMQYVYWVVLSLFLASHGRRIQWRTSLKFIFWGVNCLILSFYLVGISVDLVVLELDLSIPRNAFLFQLLCLVPFALLYCHMKYGRKGFFAFCLIYLYTGFLTQGRAGSILLFFEILFLGIVVTRPYWYSFRFVLVPLLVVLIGFTLVTVSDESVNKFVADRVEPLNSRLANLIRGEDDGNLSKDESWQTRQLMILKAKEIFAEYPYFGVGLNRFTKYHSKLAAINDYEFREFRNVSKDFLNTRSAHNSYFQILAEVGIFGLINVCLIFAFILYRFLVAVFRKMNVRVFFSVGFVAILFHFFVISSITGAITWFVVGVSLYALADSKFPDHKHYLKISVQSKSI